jgi:hypothetical protein
MYKKLAVLYIAIFLIGCTAAVKQPVQPQRTSVLINVSKDKVWSLLVTEVGLKFPVQAIEKDSGLISTQFVNMPVGFNNMGVERYAYQPSGFLYTWSGLRMTMRIMAVESEPNQTMISINAHYEAYESNFSHSWMVIRSNGAVENRILTNIEQKIRSTAH